MKERVACDGKKFPALGRVDQEVELKESMIEREIHQIRERKFYPESVRVIRVVRGSKAPAFWTAVAKRRDDTAFRAEVAPRGFLVRYELHGRF